MENYISFIAKNPYQNRIFTDIPKAVIEEAKILFQESDDHYYGDKFFITNSMSKNFLSPEMARSYLEHGNPDKEHLRFGRWFHQMVLEPKKFQQLHLPMQKADARTNVGKALKATYEAQGDELGKKFIPGSDWKRLFNMRAMLINNPELMHIILTAKKEFVVIWQDFETGLWCKSKIDLLNSNMVIDLKTTQAPIYTAKEWSHVIDDWDYEQQAAAYTEGAGVKEFAHIISNKEFPHNAGFVRMSEATLAIGKEKWAEALYRVKKFMIDDAKMYEKIPYFFTGIS